MKITIIGTGYVGLVTGACFAELGNEVFCIDIDARKIELLNNGGLPVYEPGLKALIARNLQAGRFSRSQSCAGRRTRDWPLYEPVYAGCQQIDGASRHCAARSAKHRRGTGRARQ